MVPTYLVYFVIIVVTFALAYYATNVLVPETSRKYFIVFLNVAAGLTVIYFLLMLIGKAPHVPPLIK